MTHDDILKELSPILCRWRRILLEAGPKDRFSAGPKETPTVFEYLTGCIAPFSNMPPLSLPALFRSFLPKLEYVEERLDRVLVPHYAAGKSLPRAVAIDYLGQGKVHGFSLLLVRLSVLMRKKGGLRRLVRYCLTAMYQAQLKPLGVTRTEIKLLGKAPEELFTKLYEKLQARRS